MQREPKWMKLNIEDERGTDIYVECRMEEYQRLYIHGKLKEETEEEDRELRGTIILNRKCGNLE